MSKIHFEIREKLKNCEPIVTRGTLEKPYQHNAINAFKKLYPEPAFSHSYWEEQITPKFYLEEQITPNLLNTNSGITWHFSINLYIIHMKANLDTKYNEKTLTFGYSKTAKKWEFISAEHKYTFLTKLRGGRDTAVKIARQVLGGLARTGGNGIDNLARQRINAITGVGITQIGVSIPILHKGELV